MPSNQPPGWLPQSSYGQPAYGGQSPYQPPGPGYYVPGPAEIMAPARRAGLLQMAVGALCILSGACVGAIAAGAPFKQMLDSGQIPPTARPPGMSNDELAYILRVAMVTMSSISALLGIFLVGLGALVRRGKRGALVSSIIACVIGLIPTGLMTLAIGARLAVDPAGVTPGSALVAIVALGLFIWLLVWLMAAMRARPWLVQPPPEAWSYLGDPSQGWPYPAPGGYGYGQPPAPPQQPVQPPQAPSPPNSPPV